MLGSSVDPTTFFIAWLIAGAASIGVFLHADKHGSRHATAWGIGTFLFLGLVAPIYVIRYRLQRRRRQL